MKDSVLFFFLLFFLLSAKIEYKRECQNQNDIRGDREKKRRKKKKKSRQKLVRAHRPYNRLCIHHYISAMLGRQYKRKKEATKDIQYKIYIYIYKGDHYIVDDERDRISREPREKQSEISARYQKKVPPVWVPQRERMAARIFFFFFLAGSILPTAPRPAELIFF